MSTLGQSRALTRDFISQEDTANTDFTDSELNGYSNMGVRFLGALVKHPRDMVEIQVEEGKPAYNLPSDAVIIRTAYFGDVSVSGDVLPLFIGTEESLKVEAPSWLDESTASRGRPQRIILWDRNTVLVNPTPNAAQAAAGKKLHLGYVYQASPLVADGDEIDLPLVYHDLVAEYAFYLCLMSKLNMPDKAAMVLKTLMDKAKKLENLIVKEMEGALGFVWGGSMGPDDEGGLYLR
jgi:hypothetical protein